MKRRTFLKSASIGSLVGGPRNCILLKEYVSTYRDPARVHWICKKYRSAVTIEVEHDRADKEVSKRIDCPMLHLWNGCPLDTFDRSQTSQSDAIWRTGFRCQIIRGDFHLRSPEKTAGMRLLVVLQLRWPLLTT